MRVLIDCPKKENNRAIIHLPDHATEDDISLITAYMFPKYNFRMIITDDLLEKLNSCTWGNHIIWTEHSKRRLEERDAKLKAAESST